MMSSSVQTTNSSGGGAGPVAPQLSTTSPPITPHQQINVGQQTAANRGVQVQVLSGNGTHVSANGPAGNTNSSHDLLSQLGGIRLAPEHRQQLLLAAQLQQQLRSSSVVLQPTLQGVTLLPTTSTSITSTG